MQFIEAEQQGFRFIQQDGKVYAVARTLDVQDPRTLRPDTLRDLELDGVCYRTNSVAEAWIAIAGAPPRAPN